MAFLGNLAQLFIPFQVKPYKNYFSHNFPQSTSYKVHFFGFELINFLKVVIRTYTF